ncbi:MAG TPA: hypothetical protein VHK47_18655 [Polyangia bacterium]|jgi:hypothetical protein|nr:hypothetical protein [Polyangia bacterium]
MTISIIKMVSRAAVFGGAVALLSPVAFADEIVSQNPQVPTQIPDHAEAQSRSGAALVVPTAEKAAVPPDHATAEADGPPAALVPMAERFPGVPDHATAENRGRAEK